MILFFDESCGGSRWQVAKWILHKATCTWHISLHKRYILPMRVFFYVFSTYQNTIHYYYHSKLFEPCFIHLPQLKLKREESPTHTWLQVVVISSGEIKQRLKTFGTRKPIPWDERFLFTDPWMQWIGKYTPVRPHGSVHWVMGKLHSRSHEQWRKSWLFRVDRDYTTQLCGDYNKQSIRIKDPY